MKCNSYELFFEAFSNRTRWKIIEVLRKCPKTVSEICDLTKEEQSKVSHNLKKLKSCHFVDVRQKGKSRVYSLNQDTIVPLLNLVENHVQKYCCKTCERREK